jgi:hypothetical protein
MKNLPRYLRVVTASSALLLVVTPMAAGQDFFSELGRALSGGGGSPRSSASFSGGQGQPRRPPPSKPSRPYNPIDFNQGPVWNPRTSAKANSAKSGAGEYGTRVPGRVVPPRTSHPRYPETRNDWADGLGTLFDTLGKAAADASRNSGNDRPNYRRPQGGYQPQPYYQPQPQPQYYQPQPVVSQPAPAPARNVVRQQRPSPKANDGFSLTDDTSGMSAEFDARQANEASKGAGKIDAALEDNISRLQPPDEEAKNDLREAILSGDPEKMKEFKDKHGGKLSDENQKALDVRIALGEYERDVSSGLLTGPGKDKRLEEINDKFAALGDTPLKMSLEDNLAQMDKFNELGKLSELAQDSDNPWDVMWEGAQSAGYPVSFLAEVSGMPMMEDPLNDSTASGTATTVILNPEENGQTINYNLGPYPYTIAAGQSQRLEKSYVISFDPGNGGAIKKYTLGTGTYKFVLKDGGWELKTVKVEVTIDNSQYEGTFNYLVDGKHAVLQPGQAADLSSQLPIVIEFDRGDGGKPARKVLTEGTFVVGVDVDEQRLDLFDASEATEFIAADDKSPEILDVSDFELLDSKLEALTAGKSTTQVSKSKSKAKSKNTDKAKQIQEALARLKAKS